jgi:hypothetical protein
LFRLFLECALDQAEMIDNRSTLNLVLCTIEASKDMKYWFTSIIFALTCSGCAYEAKPTSVPAFDTVTSFSTKVPGKWILFVDGARMDATIRPRDANCSAHTFPLLGSSSFGSSTRQTFANLFERVEEVQSPIPVSEARARGARGLIVVRAERVDGFLQVVPGFWSAKIASDLEASASIQVDGAAGRLFGQTFDARGRDEAEAGFACSGGSESLQRAAQKAFRDLVRRLGEGVANSERVRMAR